MSNKLDKVILKKKNSRAAEGRKTDMYGTLLKIFIGTNSSKSFF
jgi:hypothetical protein